MKRKIPVVYICGLGYSGSTLLDLLLGSHSQMESVGEIHHYSEYRGICTCMQPVKTCPYWREVKARFQDALAGEQRSLADVNTKNIFFRGLGAKFDFFARLRLRFEPEFVHNYGIDNFCLYQAIQQVSGKKIIVDSSKELRRFACLNASGRFQFKVVYLLRECSGYLYSWKKRRYGSVVKTTILDNEGNVDYDIQHRRFDGFLKNAIVWYFRQLAFLRYLKAFHAGHTLVVRYEELCRNPEQQLRRICDAIGIPFETGMLNFGDRVHHNLAGNPMRIHKRKSRTIRYDDAWKSRLHPRELFACRILQKRLYKKIDRDLFPL